MSISYVHTNIIARKWRMLAQFYIDVFNCTPRYPERDMSGKWIDEMTNIPDVHIVGIHLELPGTGGTQTLEIFSYEGKPGRDKTPLINDRGFSHIAFRTDDVPALAQKVLAHGGKHYGEMVKTDIQNAGRLTAVYMRDPENNIVEIQSWEHTEN